MRAIGENALATNFGRWIWGDQISSPKTMNVIAAVGSKHKRHFTIDRDDFIPGRVSSRDEISRVNTRLKRLSHLGCFGNNFLYLIWASFFKDYLLILCNIDWFLMEIDFCRSRVIHGLFLFFMNLRLNWT